MCRQGPRGPCDALGVTRQHRPRKRLARGHDLHGRGAEATGDGGRVHGPEKATRAAYLEPGREVDGHAGQRATRAKR